MPSNGACRLGREFLAGFGVSHHGCAFFLGDDRRPSLVGRSPMTQSTDVADQAPTGSVPTDYDEQHMVVYVRLLDAERDGADWQEVARVVLQIDPSGSQVGRAGPGKAI